MWVENLMDKDVAILVCDYAFGERQGLRQGYTVHVGRGGFRPDGEPAIHVADVGAFTDWEIVSAAELGSEHGDDLVEIGRLDGIERERALYRLFETHGRRIGAVHLWTWGPTSSAQIGFAGREGVFLTRPGSNSAIGSFRGGFPTPEAAEAYIERYLAGTGDWKVSDHRAEPEAYPASVR